MDGDGEVSFEEFMLFMAYKALDGDGNGRIFLDDLEALVERVRGGAKRSGVPPAAAAARPLPRAAARPCRARLPPLLPRLLFWRALQTRS